MWPTTVMKTLEGETPAACPQVPAPVGATPALPRELSPSCTEVSARSPFQRSALPSWTPVLTLPCRVLNLRPSRRKDPAPV